MPTILEEKDAIREVLAEYCFRLDDGDFAELHGWPAVRPDLRGISGRVISGCDLHHEAELDRSLFQCCP